VSKIEISLRARHFYCIHLDRLRSQKSSWVGASSVGVSSVGASPMGVSPLAVSLAIASSPYPEPKIFL